MRNDFVTIEELMLKEEYFIIWKKLDCGVRHFHAVPNRIGKE
jgi:hypothetical protein